MPNQLSPAKKRTTYTEFFDVFEKLDKYAAKIRTDRSFVIRSATQFFVSEHKNKRWKAVPYKSESKRGVRRITYAEWGDVSEYMSEVAARDRIDLSALIRAAVHAYISKMHV